MDGLEEDLTCSVCYQLFSDPRVLPCSHTFCKVCLDNLLQASSTHSIWRPLRLPIKCPNCRSVVELPMAGVDALPSNVSLRAIVEKYQSDGAPRPPSCPEHPRQPLNMYCVQDQQLICGLCLTVGQHRGHSIDDLQAAYARERRTPQLLAELSQRRCAEACELGEQLQQEKARCDALLRQDREQVTQFFQSLNEVLARKKDAYLQVLDAAAAEVAQAYEPLIIRAKELQEQQLELLALASCVEEEEESPLLFLQQLHLFRERVDRLVQTPLPRAVQLSVAPRAAEFLQQHWPAVRVGGLEEAPVPTVCCCSGSSSSTGAVAAESGTGGRGRKLHSILVIVLLLLLLGAALYGQLSGFSVWKLLGLNTAVTASVEEAAHALVTTIAVTLQEGELLLCSLGEKVAQQVFALFR